MSDRDELVDEIAGHPIGSGYYSTNVGIDEAREIADAILAAGYQKPVKCGADCCCKQEDAITTEITVKEME